MAADKLAGSFFLEGGRNDEAPSLIFISTLAYNLALSLSQPLRTVHRACPADQYITRRSLERQFQQLIADPIRSAVMPPLPMVDALGRM